MRQDATLRSAQVALRNIYPPMQMLDLQLSSGTTPPLETVLRLHRHHPQAHSEDWYEVLKAVTAHQLIQGRSIQELGRAHERILAEHPQQSTYAGAPLFSRVQGQYVLNPKVIDLL